MVRLAAAVVALSLAFAPTQTSAQFIDFDGTGAPCGFSSTTPLTTYYAALGITFGGQGSILNECGNFGVNALSGSSFWAFNTDVFGSGTATINFTQPVSFFSIFASGGTQAADFKVSIFDAGGAFIGGTGGNTASGQWAQFSYGAASIGKVEITSNDTHFVFDDLNATGNVVPEPSTLILLGTGLFGVAVMARRRKEEE